MKILMNKDVMDRAVKAWGALPQCIEASPEKLPEKQKSGFVSEKAVARANLLDW